MVGTFFRLSSRDTLLDVWKRPVKGLSEFLWLWIPMLLAMSAPSAAHAANLLTDGSFEAATVGNAPSQGALPGSTSWTISTNGTTNSPIAVITYGTNVPQDPLTTGSPNTAGSKAIYFTTDTGSQTLSQTISVVSGKRYTVGADLIKVFSGSGNLFDSTIAFQMGSTTLGTVSTSQLKTPASATDASAWTNESFSFTATSTGSITFSLVFTGGATTGLTAKDIALDRAFVILTTPEPAALASFVLTLGGILALTCIKRRRGLALLSGRHTN